MQKIHRRADTSDIRISEVFLPQLKKTILFRLLAMSDPFNPYAFQHAHPNGPGDSWPTALQVVEDENLIDLWADKVVLVTGGTSGIVSRPSEPCRPLVQG